MRRGLVIAIAGLAGCQLVLGIDDPTLGPRGGGDAGSEVDAGGQGDAGTDFSCDPVNQTGCPVMQKCAPVLEPDGMSFRTDCVADGTVPIGGSCTGPSGPGSSDDCIGDGVCFFGICRQMCSVAAGCAGAFACGQVNGLFDDQTNNTGLCSPTCDPVAQDCTDADHGCYLNAQTGGAICAGVINASAVQGVMCANGQCFLNSCAVGHGALVSSAGDGQADSCGFYCTPIDTHTGNPGAPAGDPTGINCASTFGGARPDGPGAGFQCRFVQTFLDGATSSPASAGVCVDPAVNGDCTSCDITDAGTFAATCAQGCVSSATEAAIP